MLWAHGAGAPFGTADGAQEDGVGRFGFCEGFGGEGSAMDADRALRREWELDMEPKRGGGGGTNTTN